MFCPRCGSEVGQTDRFCGKCGSGLPHDDGIPRPASKHTLLTDDTQTPAALPRWSRSRRQVIVIAVTVGLVAVAGLVFAANSGPHSALSPGFSGAQPLPENSESAIISVTAEQFWDDEKSLSPVDFRVKYGDGKEKFAVRGIFSNVSENPSGTLFAHLNRTDGRECAYGGEDDSIRFNCFSAEVHPTMPLEEVARLEPGQEVEMTCQLSRKFAPDGVCTWDR